MLQEKTIGLIMMDDVLGTFVRECFSQKHEPHQAQIVASHPEKCQISIGFPVQNRF